MDAMCGSKAGSDLFGRLSLEKVAESSTTTAPSPRPQGGATRDMTGMNEKNKLQF